VTKLYWIGAIELFPRSPVSPARAVMKLRWASLLSIENIITLYNNIYYFPVEDRVSLPRHVKAFMNSGGFLLLTTCCQGWSLGGRSAEPMGCCNRNRREAAKAGRNCQAVAGRRLQECENHSPDAWRGILCVQSDFSLNETDFRRPCAVLRGQAAIGSLKSP
jgi:hypothetical protein